MGLREPEPTEDELQAIEDEIDRQEAEAAEEDMTELLEDFKVDGKTFH